MNFRNATIPPQLPLAFGVIAVFVLCGFLGIVAADLGEDDWRSTSVCVLSGISGVVIAAKAYHGLGTARQGVVRRAMLMLCLVFSGAMFGGIPGGLAGHWIGGETGEFVGWLVAASIGGIVAGYWGLHSVETSGGCHGEGEVR